MERFCTPLRATLAALVTLFTLAVLGAACARAETRSQLDIPSLDRALQLPATLIRPDGDGPFPAVVIMHDCSGLGPASSGAPQRWASELVPLGYVVLIPDSFVPRGFPRGTCLLPGAQTRSANGYVRAGDAYAALAMLRTLPQVDGRRVGIMGGSHGGWTTLAALFEPARADDPLSDVKRNGFAAAIALYPSCAARYGSWLPVLKNGSTGPMVSHSGEYKPVAPLLILAGELDDWTPAEPCNQLVESGRSEGYPLDIRIYPGAHHSFDNDRPINYNPRRNNPNNPTGRGATTEGHPAAWADAKQRVAEFFALHLKSR